MSLALGGGGVSLGALSTTNSGGPPSLRPTIQKQKSIVNTFFSKKNLNTKDLDC